jgi:hypothetical protein
MKRLAYVVFVGTPLIAVPHPAIAADGSAQYEVMPPGAVSCASWTLGRDEAGRGYTVLPTQDGIMRAEREGWVAGYISALNVEVLPGDRGASRDLTEGIARDELMASIDNYCAENPLHSLLSATASVSLELANAWLVAHPAGEPPGGERARLPVAGLPPSDQNISVGEEVAPSDAAPALPELPSALAAAPASPPPVPAVPESTPPPAAPVPDAPEIPSLASVPPPASNQFLPVPAAPVEAVPAAAAPELRGAVSALAGGALLQVGAFRTNALAGQAWQAFRAEHREIVGDLSSDIQEVDLGVRGVWHRLRIGPFADRDAANARCAVLKTRGADCFVSAP